MQYDFVLSVRCCSPVWYLWPTRLFLASLEPQDARQPDQDIFERIVENCSCENFQWHECILPNQFFFGISPSNLSQIISLPNSPICLCSRLFHAFPFSLWIWKARFVQKRLAHRACTIMSQSLMYFCVCNQNAKYTNVIRPIWYILYVGVYLWGQKCYRKQKPISWFWVWDA